MALTTAALVDHRRELALARWTCTRTSHAATSTPSSAWLAPWQARGATCLLSGETASSRRIASGVRKGSLAAIREDEDTARAAAAAAEAEGTAQLLQLAQPGGGGGGAVAEDDDLTWFSAGVRIGVGVGLGVCIGAGLGVGLLLKSYSSATQALGRRLGRVAA